MSFPSDRCPRAWETLGLWARVLLGAVLLFAAISKTFDATAGEGGPARFAALIESHRVIPASWAPAAAWAVLVAEFVLGILLLLPRSPRIVPYGAALLLAAFSAYLVFVHVTQGSVKCGCLGRIDAGEVWSGLTRNAALIAAAWLASSAQGKPRARLPAATLSA